MSDYGRNLPPTGKEAEMEAARLRDESIARRGSDSRVPVQTMEQFTGSDGSGSAGQPAARGGPNPAPGSGAPGVDDEISTLIDMLASLQGEGQAQVAAALGLDASMGELTVALEGIQTDLDALLALCTKHSERGGQVGRILEKLRVATGEQKEKLVGQMKEALARGAAGMEKARNTVHAIKTKVAEALPGLQQQKGGRRRTRRARRRNKTKRGGFVVRARHSRAHRRYTRARRASKRRATARRG